MFRKALFSLALMVPLSSAALAGACPPVVRPPVIVRPGPGPCPPPFSCDLNPQPLPPRHM